MMKALPAMISELLFNHRLASGIMLITSLLAIAGCNKGTENPNVDHIDGSFEMIRFEQELWALDSNASDPQIDSLARRYPIFWDLYFHKILPVAPPDSTSTRTLNDAIRHLLASPRMRFLADTVIHKYGDMADIEAELYDAFQHYQYHFPGNRPPNVYTLISDFGFFPFIFDDSLRDGVGISLEMFMGEDFPYLQFMGNHPGFSDYLTRSFNREHMVRRTMEVIVDDILGPPPGDRLLDLMVHNGKKLYILEQIIPQAPDSVIHDFSASQIEWLNSNERNLWAHFLTEDLLYTNSFQKIQKLVNYSPNAPGLPPQAPGRAANWTGWKIIHAWKKQNPDLSVLDIVATRDAQRILEEARYRPR